VFDVQAMIVLVTGGRNYADRAKLFATLDALQPISILIHGAAAGADRLAGEWCFLRGVTCHEVHANWTAYGKKAGPMRNAKMVRIALLPRGQDVVCVAFPGGVGTADCAMKARMAGMKVMVVA